MHHSAFFHATPLLAAAPLPDGSPVSFKLEFLQPSGSFKDRGIGHMIQTLVDAGNVSRLICSSGGNAGHAVATAAQKLGLPADVFVPTTTLPLMREKIAARGANVVVSGANWNEADAEARRKLAADPGARYIPPFDDPLIWEGNSTLVDELVAACTADTLPSVIVLSVGGGGLLRGVQLGLERHGLSDRISVVACETEGAASFAAALAAGVVVRLPEINTVASTLGALAVTGATLLGPCTTKSCVVTDREAVSACLRFAQVHRVLVEPACGAALAAIYEERHRAAHIAGAARVAVVVCGGSAVSIELLEAWRVRFGL